MERGKIIINYEADNFKACQNVKKILSLMLFMTLVYLMTVLVNAEDMSKYPCNAYKSDITNTKNLDKMNSFVVKSLRDKAESIPPVIDWTASMPGVDSQGYKGSCVGWAIGRYMQSFYQARDWKWDVKRNFFSPDFLYSLRSNKPGPGMYVDEALNIVKDKGTCLESYMPYTQEPEGMPSVSAYKNALGFKALSVSYLPWSTSSVESFKTYMSQGNVGVIAIPVYSDFDYLNSENPIYDEYDPITYRGSHAICIIGYEDTKQAFKFINSWGSHYGIGGYGYISYNLFNEFQCNMYAMQDEDTTRKILAYSQTQTNSKVGNNYTYDLHINGTHALSKKGSYIYSHATSWTLTGRIKENDSIPDISNYVSQKLVRGWNTVKFNVMENSGTYKYQKTVVTLRIYVYN